LRVIWPNAVAIKRTPIRRTPAGEPRPTRPARSAAGTARRTRWPSQGGFAVTRLFRRIAHSTSPPALAPPKTGRLIRPAIRRTTTGGASACYATRITRVPNRREFVATACQTAVSSLG
jgi:hypothetical protein